jgi:hypothetical protein
MSLSRIFGGFAGANQPVTSRFRRTTPGGIESGSWRLREKDYSIRSFLRRISCRGLISMQGAEAFCLPFSPELLRRPNGNIEASGNRRKSIRWAGLLICGAASLLVPRTAHAEAGEVTTVSGRVADDYVRARLEDGTFVPEAYTFGEGGAWTHSPDGTIDKLHFLDIARTIAPPLAAQRYVPARDPNRTKLLIMVYWGTTAGTADSGSSAIATQNLSASQTVVPPKVTSLPNGGAIVANGAGGDIRKSAQTIDQNLVFMLSVMNRLRDQADFQNARLLGYDTALMDARGLEFTALRFRQRDLVDEVEESRYFVVLMAYDFQLMLKEKKHKLLWETRFSIREHRNEFDKELAAMAQTASKYFGQDSHGLVRKRVREGIVEINDPKFIDFEPEKK